MSQKRRVKIENILRPLPVQHKLSAKDLDGGNIPVYSSETQNNGIKGYCSWAEFKIDESQGKKEQYIVFGDHTRSINVIDTDFSVMDNVKVLIPRYENLDLNYIKYMWKPIIPELGYARHWSVAKEVYIEIPVDENGEFDLLEQNIIAQKHIQINEKRDQLIKKVEVLKGIEFELPASKEITYCNVPICELFMPKGGSMKYSRKWCNTHAGKYTIYSGSTTEAFAEVDAYSYSGEYLTWVIDGLAGYIMKVNGEFDITCHRGILIPTDKCKNIYLDYIEAVLEPVFRKRVRGRMGHDGKNEYTALKPTHILNYNDTIPIPINEDGTYNYFAQKELADKYKTIMGIKNSIIKKVYELVEISLM